MYAKLFEAALGITDPWCVAEVDFDAARKALTISVDFVAGSRSQCRAWREHIQYTTRWPSATGSTG